MDLKEFTLLCEEVLDIEEGTLQLSTNLDEIEEWDSLAKMDLVSMCEEKFNLKLSLDIFNDADTLQNLIDQINGYLTESVGE
ncbi:hypothetical protein B857_00062 [Solibacillus isronensis B3W22]|uniref:Carrier domain-containing protein n=1 Tax=Solibacillus isronensis B3W22 TaxID=1224748 RepID=K1L8J8_9BACL|nr:acyl carrier protein [Solibacillus isronensis]AMO84787.1 hypothetical protein SOLI23_04080 [Solibacillus silvestris]EKB46773.1 hypothetical protein B857_00062 [Solibacillus isronensis B3W22]